MKILLSHRYFWPDTAPYAFLLRAIGDNLSAVGHEVHVFCSKPSYRKGASKRASRRETLGELDIYRCFVFQEGGALTIVRALNALLYSVGLFLRVLWLRPEIVTASTFPPVVCAFSACIASRICRAKFIYHMQDIHPDVSECVGGVMGRRPISTFLRWLDNQTIKRSHAIVVLSDDMAETVKRRQLGELPIHVISNFALGDDMVLEEPPSRYKRKNEVRRVIFAGNLGRFQNLPILIEGVVGCLARHPDVEVFFLGDGSSLPELEARWGNHPQIKFEPFLSLAQAKSIISDSEIGLVSIAAGIYKSAYPSKIQTYLGMGIPILALVEPHSQLSQELTSADVAVVPESFSPEDIAIALDDMLKTKRSRTAILNWYAENFGFRRCSEKWIVMLNGLRD